MRTEAEAAGLPTIQVSPELARFLSWLVPAVRAQTILEIGTLFGYSAVTMARALLPGGRLLSLEAEPRHAALARRNIAQLGLSDRIEVRQGKGLDLLRDLSGQFDVIFIDANKDQYVEYLDQALRLSHAGTVIVADNVWRGGRVVDGEDEAARGMQKFNEYLAGFERLQTFILPHRDGGDAASVSLVLS
jgi:predicted O-methyltransferase YrrM